MQFPFIRMVINLEGLCDLSKDHCQVQAEKKTEKEEIKSKYLFRFSNWKIKERDIGNNEAQEKKYSLKPGNPSDFFHVQQEPPYRADLSGLSSSVR